MVTRPVRMPAGFSFVEGDAIGPAGSRHLVTMVRRDDDDPYGWSWVFRPVLMSGEVYRFDEQSILDWVSSERGF